MAGSSTRKRRPDSLVAVRFFVRPKRRFFVPTCHSDDIARSGRQGWPSDPCCLDLRSRQAILDGCEHGVTLDQVRRSQSSFNGCYELPFDYAAKSNVQTSVNKPPVRVLPNGSPSGRALVYAIVLRTYSKFGGYSDPRSNRGSRTSSAFSWFESYQAGSASL